MIFKNVVFGLLCSFVAVCSVLGQNGLHLIDSLDSRHGSIGSQNYSGSWGYVAPNGREYAILGTVTGTSIIDITDAPTLTEVVHIAGPSSQWREMRTYKDRLYIVTEAGGGMQIVDLSPLPSTATLVKSFTYTSGVRNTARAHSLQIFDGYLYLNGCANWGTTAQRGAVIFSLADPDNPLYVGQYAPNYFHDSYVRNDTIFGASIYSGGGIYIADIKNKSAPIPIGKISYTGSGTHNVWTTTDGKYLISTDEIGSTPKTLKFWDLQNLPTIPESTVATYTYSPADIEHNVFVRGKYAYTAWYTGGIAVIDVRNPLAPSTAGWYDSYAGASGGYSGVWGAYPYFWSGKVIAGDMQTGLYVFSFDSLAPRTPTTLLEPADSTVFCDDNPLTFRWTRVADPVKDPHKYLLTLEGPGIDSTITVGSDTSFTLANASILGNGTTRWWITTTDEANMVPSQDSFAIVRPSRKPVVISPNGGENLKVWSTTPITWNSSVCVDSVEIALSTDNGSSWTLIEASYPAAGGSYVWNVPPAPTTSGRIRIRSLADTSMADSSDAVFEIFNSAAVTVISPNGGEVYPEGGLVQISWSSLLVGEVAIDYTLDGGATWVPAVVDTPASMGQIDWTLPSVMTRDARVRVSEATNPTVFDESDASFWISAIIFPVSASWNLVSVPVEPTSSSVADNFPPATSNAFAFDNGYVSVSQIEQGKGYWIRCDSAGSVAAIGTIVEDDTIALNVRWNIIGSISVPVSVASILPLSGTMTLSNVFGFSIDSGYTVADSIEPGSGYWVKSSEAGEIVMSGSPAIQSAGKARPDLNSLDVVEIRDALGRSRTLFLSNEAGLTKERYELPPLPPTGVFDVRFGSGGMMENAQSGSDYQILISGGAYPLTLSWNFGQTRADILIDGERVSAAGSGAMNIASATAMRLTVTSAGGSTPTSFLLHQNYPNPFNPSTRIRYELPYREKVSIKIVDVLGREIALLVDELQDEGVREVEWDANGFPSGVYFCRISAGDFRASRKLLYVR